MDESQEHIYRQNVAIVVLNSQGLILACHRNDLQGMWQIPQGGIDPGEKTIDAMYRELREEIGTDDVTLIGVLSEPIRYSWPPELYSRGYHGQEQTYFLVRLNDTAVIDLSSATVSAEFDRYEWVSEADFISRLTSFKRDVYTRALRLLDEAFPGCLLR